MTQCGVERRGYVLITNMGAEPEAAMWEAQGWDLQWADTLVELEFGNSPDAFYLVVPSNRKDWS